MTASKIREHLNDLADRAEAMEAIIAEIEKRLEGIDATDSQISAALVNVSVRLAVKNGPEAVEAAANGFYIAAMTMTEPGGFPGSE